MFDVFVFYQLNALAFRFLWLDILVIFFAVYVPYILAGVLFLLLLGNFKKSIKPIIGAGTAAILGGLLVLAINLIFYRARPFVLITPSLLSKTFVNSSFPSFHATILFAVSFFLYFYSWKRIGCIFLGISFLVALARVFTGLHWLADIIAGIMFGFVIAWGGYKAFRFLHNKNNK